MLTGYSVFRITVVQQVRVERRFSAVLDLTHLFQGFRPLLLQWAEALFAKGRLKRGPEGPLYPIASTLTLKPL